MRALRSRNLWLIIGAGLAVRVVLAFAFHGPNHVSLEEAVASQVRSGNWHALYGRLHGAWTYPPLFLPWIAGASWLSDISGLSFHGLAKLGPSLADVGLALAIYVYLGWRGAGERARLAGSGLVMLGPSFIATSSYHGQLDSVTILPAVFALMLWERRPTSTRAVEAGLLIGVGAAVKIVPLLLLPALFGSARSWREAAKLVVAAVAVTALVLAPLWLSGVNLHRVIAYTGIPGLGGLSLVVDPALGWHWMTVVRPLLNGWLPNGDAQALQHASRWITLVALMAYTAFILRYRPAPVDAAVLLWLSIYLFSPNFFLNYLIWALPFFIMAGYLAEVAILQAVLIPPTVAFYLARWPSPSTADAVVYVPLLIALWLFWVIATCVVGARIVRQRDAKPWGIQPPLVSVATNTS
jgi:Glycosyltransferase family 87